ncbi:MAG: peptidase MA family metallohydrolase [Myxococcaceae bacterium]
MSRPLLLALLLALPALAQDAGTPPHGEAKARIQNFEQSLEDWDLPAARLELSELEKLMPAQAEPLAYYRGRLAFEEGRYADAVAELTRAGVSDKPGSYLRLAKDTLKITQDDLRFESEHFVFYYPKGKDELLVPYALETLEKIRSALAEDLGWTPPGKIRVEFLNDGNELAKVSTLTREQIKTTGTIAICKFSKLMVTSPKAVVRGYDWQDTLAHEYVHLVVSQQSHNTVPIWLHEGLAKYLESRWRGKPGLAMTPSTLALLGQRVRTDKLVPFEKMHPSMALLPSAEDAATAFAEVFFAIDLLFKEHGAKGLRGVISALAAGKDDKRAVEAATGRSFAAFEKGWLAHLKKQPFPKELIPRSTDERNQLKDDAPGKAKNKEHGKGKEISFGDFAEVEEVEARKLAHLGELMRERNRPAAAAEEYGRAQRQVGDRYESLSNKYALSLMELGRLDEAKRVLEGSLTMHPGSATTHVHLGRIALRKKGWATALTHYIEALAADPFDEEIHLALFHVHGELGQKALAERARKAVVVLTGVPTEAVPSMAAALVKEGRLESPVHGGAARVDPQHPDAGRP